MSLYASALLGGCLIGVASVMLLILNGRIAGISGIAGRLLQGSNVATNAAFVAGLMLGPVAYFAAFSHWPAITITVPIWLIAPAGLLVGFGSRMGSGCTSGHGVMGFARLSPRSIAAVATFLSSGVVTVAALRLAGL